MSGPLAQVTVRKVRGKSALLVEGLEEHDRHLLELLHHFPATALRRLEARLQGRPKIDAYGWGYSGVFFPLRPDGTASVGCLIGISFTRKEFLRLSLASPLLLGGELVFPAWAHYGAGLNRGLLSNERLERLRQLVAVEARRREHHRWPLRLAGGDR